MCFCIFHVLGASTKTPCMANTTRNEWTIKLNEIASQLVEGSTDSLETVI